ncbi:MAG: hydantoinase/oxoprolinase family protein [Xanthobacteraceae bacterium]
MDSPANWLVGVDIGGTFTDVVAIDRTGGAARTGKVVTRPGDRVASLMAALAAVDLDWDRVGDLVHGTTMVTNAIVQGQFARTALITTSGFADTLAIGRQNRRYLYHLDRPPKRAPLVPEALTFEVDERLDHDGNVLHPLADEAIDAVVDRIAAAGAEAVAVSLLHAYANPAHEERLAARIAARIPYVAVSNRVNPEAREYERTATTVLSAGVMPLAAGYLDSLEARKPAASRLHLFHSGGDMASPEAVRDLPLALAMSGPAAGVAAAAQVARDLALDHAISFDMGGTTTDACLVSHGRAEIASDRRLNDYPLRQSMVAVESIGAGGGSIAVFDRGALRVGPQSAGAAPGPACYGRGGTQATVTDANLLLGYLDRDRLYGNELRLDEGAARAAIARLAADAGMTVTDTALGIVTVANQAMVRALRRVTVERGIDGRRCTLIAFGGAGPMHAVAVARAFGIAQVIVPAQSSVFSALGCVHADMGYARQQTLRMAGARWDRDAVDRVRARLRERLAAPLVAAGNEPEKLHVEETAAVRYRGQSYAVEIAQPDFSDPAGLGTRFHAEHHRLYGFATDEPWELTAIRMRVSAPRENPALLVTAGAAAPGLAAARTSLCIFDRSGERETPRRDRAALTPGNAIEGPAIIEDAFSTVVVPPGATLVADACGHLMITVGAAS